MKKIKILLLLLIANIFYCSAQNIEDGDDFINRYKALVDNYKSCQKEVQEQNKRIEVLETKLKHFQSTKAKAGDHIETTKTTEIESDGSGTFNTEVSRAIQRDIDSINKDVRGFGTYYAIQFGVKKETSFINSLSNIRLLGFNKAQQNFIYRIDNIESYEKSESILKSIEPTQVYTAFITKFVNGEATDYYNYNQTFDKSKLLIPTRYESNTGASLSGVNTSSWEYGKDENGNDKININTKNLSIKKEDNLGIKMQSNWEYSKDENGVEKIIVKP